MRLIKEPRCDRTSCEKGENKKATVVNAIHTKEYIIEHFPSPEPLIKELFRVCKPGGAVLISTLDAYCEAAQVHTYPEHMVAWDSPEDLAQHFGPYGPTRAWVLGHYFMVECRKEAVR